MKTSQEHPSRASVLECGSAVPLWFRNCLQEAARPADSNPPPAATLTSSLSWPQVLFWTLLAAASFHAAYASRYASGLVVVYLFALLQLARADKWRKAFYPGLAVGFLIALGRLDFFWNIFSGGAAALWLVYSFWIGLFAALARLCLFRFGPRWGWLPLPFLWVGLELRGPGTLPLDRWLAPFSAALTAALILRFVLFRS